MLIRLFAAVLLIFTVLPGGVSHATAQTDAPKTKPIRYWTTQWSYPNIDVNDLAEKLKAIGIELPVSVAGKAFVQFDVSVPLNRLRDGRAYRIEGKIASKRLQLEQLVLHDFRADLTYRDGVLELGNLGGFWSDAIGTASNAKPDENNRERGALRGKATAELLPIGNLEGEIIAKSLEMAPIYRLTVTSQPEQVVSGLFSGDVKFDVPVKQIRDLTAWKVTANVQADQVRLGNSAAVNVRTGPVVIAGGKFTADAMTVTATQVPSASLSASLQVDLQNRQTFEAWLAADDLPVDALSRTFVGGRVAGGKLDLQLQLRGELSSRRFIAKGRIASPRFDLSGIDLGLIEHEFSLNPTAFSLVPIDAIQASAHPDIPLQLLDLQYRLTPTSLSLDSLSASLFGGKITGNAKLSLEEGGTHQLRLQWQDLRPQIAGAILPFAGEASALSSGTVIADVPSDHPADAKAKLNLQLSEIRIAHSRVGQLNLQAQLDGQRFRAQGHGILWGGQATANIDSSAGMQSIRGQFNISAMQLSEIAKLVPGHRLRLSGQASMIVNLQPPSDSSGAPRTDIRLSTTDIRLDRKPLSPRLELLAKTQGREVQVDSIHGSFAGGQIRASGRWSLAGGARQLQISASDIDASRAVLAWRPDFADQIGGKFSGSATVIGGQGLRARGTFSARRTSLFAVPMGTVNSAFTASLSATLKRWVLDLSSIRGQLAGGQIGGEAKLTSSTIRGGSSDLTSRWQMRNIDFGQVLSEVTGSLPSFAHGRLTGELSLGGKGIRGIGDLNGRFQAELGDTQSNAIPGLVAADRFLGVISLAQVRFEEGEVRGVIGGGAARLEEFWLRSNRVKVWADGKIQLASGGCDLSVVISTGNFEWDNAEIISLATQLAIQSAIPVAGLVEVNRLLSNRTVHLAFTGPVTDPRIRLKPLEMIRDEAVRFLVREILVAASVSSGSR